MRKAKIYNCSKCKKELKRVLIYKDNTGVKIVTDFWACFNCKKLFEMGLKS